MNLTGQQFNNWKVIKYVGDKKWLCECQCDNHVQKEVAEYSLIKGSSKSCGCLRKKMNSESKKIDLSGQHFGEWEVLSYQGSSMWLCKCSCGTIKAVKAQYLRNGVSKSCGHNTTKFKDLTGQMFGNWLVKKYIGKRYWECECQCENHTVRNICIDNLLSGKSTSCGCNKKNSSRLIDLTNQKFGELTVEKYIGGNKWLCKCSCGNYSIHYSHNLRRSKTLHCGCKDTKSTKEEVENAINEYIEKYSKYPYIDELANMLDKSITQTKRYLDEYGLGLLIENRYRSKAEEEINTLFPTPYKQCRNILNGFELDLFYKDKSIAIEYNGLYWHSDMFKSERYHQEKTIACAKQGIHLIHIFEYEWKNEDTKRKIISILNGKLGLLNKQRIYARNTKIVQLDNETCSKFLDEHHLQGNTHASIKLGCMYNDKLIGVMTFGKPRFNKNYEYEVVRLCWLPDIIVIGGTEKLFKHFVKDYNPHSIIAYVNIAKFTGNTYTKLGFKPTQNGTITEPNYVWANSKCEVVLSRYETQKHKLMNIGLGNDNETEDEIMDSLGYYKVYDSGSLKLEWIGESIKCLQEASLV